VDMKGGVALSLALLEVLAARPDAYAEVALLLVNDEEWRVGGLDHTHLFDGFDACLCFEAGQHGPNGEEGLIVRRKAASTLKVVGHGLSSHSGSAPDRGRNALLALAAAAQAVAACHDPHGEDRLSAVPTIINSGEAFNVVPSGGELYCDMRADTADAFERVLRAVPEEVGGVRLAAEIVRLWPGMDSRESTRELLSRTQACLGRPVIPVERGGASDASHVATRIPITVDGLGPRGGQAHNPDEYVLAVSIRERAEVALALMAALLPID
jgi:glutamate carboxypeptidase